MENRVSISRFALRGRSVRRDLYGISRDSVGLRGTPWQLRGPIARPAEGSRGTRCRPRGSKQIFLERKGALSTSNTCVIHGVPFNTARKYLVPHNTQDDTTPGIIFRAGSLQNATVGEPTTKMVASEILERDRSIQTRRRVFARYVVVQETLYLKFVQGVGCLACYRYARW